MSDLLINILQAGIALLPFLLILGVWAIYFLVRFWRLSVSQDLKSLRGLLRSVEAQIKHHKKQVAVFQPSDPEPYGSLAKSFLQQLRVAEDSKNSLMAKYVEIQATIRRLDSWNILQLPKIPFAWFKIKQEVHSLWESFLEYKHVQEILPEIYEQIERQGLLTAALAKKELHRCQETMTILQTLQAAGLHGATFDAANATVNEWLDALTSNLPAFLMSEDESVILTHADKDSIIQVHGLSKKAEAIIGPIYSNARLWNDQREALKEKLDLINNELKNLFEQLANLEINAVYPFVWEHSRVQAARLEGHVTTIGAIEKTRSVEQLENELGQAESTLQQVASLSENCIKVRNHYHEIISLLTSADLRKSAEWSQKAGHLVEQIGRYDPQNWLKEDDVKNLKTDLEAFIRLQGRVISSDAGFPVHESMLESTLTATRQLTFQYQILRSRVNRIRERYHAIQALERNSREAVQKGKALLNQVSLIQNANPILGKAAIKDLAALQPDLDVMLKELDRNQQGVVEKKVQKADAILEKARQATHQWLSRLRQDLLIKLTSLKEKVNQLDEIVKLEDPALNNTRKTLSELETIEKEIKGAVKSEISLEAAVSALKAANESWQQCVVGINSLAELESPVTERHHKAAAQRQSTRSALEATNLIVPEERSWPPTTLFLNAERHEFTQLEERWENLHTSQLTSIHYVTQISDLLEDYQRLENQLKRISDLAQQEQKRIRDLENRFNESLGLWQKLQERYHNNRLVQDGILALNDEVNRDFKTVRLRYLQHNLPFNQVIQQMRAVCRKVDESVVALDNTRTLDINGEIQQVQ